jgi:hypothetical protein
MPFEVTEAVRQQARRFFTEPQASLVIAELEQTDLPLISNNGERVHLAVLMLSHGDMKRFHTELKWAMDDWRDTLVNAGLADEDWPNVLRRAGVHGFKEPNRE